MFKTALLLALASASAVLAGEKSAGCGKSSTITTKAYTMSVNGKNRQYYVKLPDRYEKDKPHKLVFSWHQRGASMQKNVQGEDTNHGGALPFYGLPPLSNGSAIFVSPDGIGGGWNNAGGEDVTFFDQMYKTVTNDLCVDTGLVFSTGFSFGGGMSFALACARPEIIRAVAIISGAQLSGCSGGTKPVAYYGQHGTSDSVLNVAMGRSLRDRFVKNNGCTPLSSEPQPGQNSVKTDYKGCKEGYPVQWVIHKGDHNPSQRDGNNLFAPKNTWDFFSQFT
jgi:poly(3-hydroxybutyrate) depolymerase